MPGEKYLADTGSFSQKTREEETPVTLHNRALLHPSCPMAIQPGSGITILWNKQYIIYRPYDRLVLYRATSNNR